MEQVDSRQPVRSESTSGVDRKRNGGADISVRPDPRQMKSESKYPQRRPESVPSVKAERSASSLQLPRPETASGMSTSAENAERLANLGSGFQPYSKQARANKNRGDSSHFNVHYAAGEDPLGSAGTHSVPALFDSGNSDWEARDEMRQRELDEMRARVAQMEKTMRWWSDCTANWREKWSKVRGERNKAREECRQLRTRLDEVVKECTILKREKHDLAAEIEQIATITTSLDVSSISSHVTVMHGCTSNEEDPVAGDIEMDTKAQLQHEKDEKAAMATQIEHLAAELQSLRIQAAAGTSFPSESSSHDAVAGAMSRPSSVNTQWPECVVTTSTGHEDEAPHLSKGASVSTERQLAELRSQLEMLQADNAKEWAQRERVDSERYALERDNKKLKVQLDDLREELDMCAAAANGIKEGEVKATQRELAERNKEIVELKHTHSKMKKLMQERGIEVEHSKRRAEQYEVEVKKLRARIDELKRELASTEDDLDSQGNIAKKLQRAVDELQEMNENLTIQLEHAHSRLKSSAADALDYFKNRSLKGVTDAHEEESADAFDSEDEFVT